MARPLQDGVEYFPKNTDFYTDDKVRLLRAEFGAKGMYMLDYLLCELYGKNGYFIKWDRNKCFLVSDGAGCGCSPEFISEFVQGCIRCSFFDERVFESFGVLTSAGIQRRYIRMFNGRDYIQMQAEYWLLDCNSRKDVPTSVLNKINFISFKTTENPDKSTENPDKSTENPQSKINKKKEDETKLFDDTLCKPFKQEWDAYIEMRKKIKKPMTDNAKKLAVKKLQELSRGDVDLIKAILNQSIFNSWQGLFQLKKDGDINNGRSNQIKQSSESTRKNIDNVI